MSDLSWLPAELKGNADVVSYCASIAEQAERYPDMVKLMQHLINFNRPLTNAERNLFSVAYKNVVGARRSAWRVVVGALATEKNKEKDAVTVAMANKLKEVIETELFQICEEALDILKNKLIPAEELPEGLVFYYKMMGDYYRYLAEVQTGDTRKVSVEAAEEAYTTAVKTAEEKLTNTHPIRLGLALNFSVFHYEIKDQKETACSLAKTAFDNAIAELDTINEEAYKDSTLIMQLLRDNLTLWTSDTDPE